MVVRTGAICQPPGARNGPLKTGLADVPAWVNYDVFSANRVVQY